MEDPTVGFLGLSAITPLVALGNHGHLGQTHAASGSLVSAVLLVSAAKKRGR